MTRIIQQKYTYRECENLNCQRKINDKYPKWIKYCYIHRRLNKNGR